MSFSVASRKRCHMEYHGGIMYQLCLNFLGLFSYENNIPRQVNFQIQ